MSTSSTNGKALWTRQRPPVFEWRRWPQNAAQQAALLKRALDDAGTPIGPNDLLIAGHALANHCVLVSDNVREFSRVEGLALENWVAR